MRLRNIPGADDVLNSSSYVIQAPQQHKGNFFKLFGNNHPIHIEIGMGKGKFIHAMAKLNPQVNYVGIEKYSSVLLRALEKMDREEEPLPNLVFIRMDAENIEKVFAEGEVDGIYLNFSDPWPKDRHAKRRLTSTTFFGRYNKILKKDGKVEFKTDNRPLFEFSLESVKEAGWNLVEHTFDLHHHETMNEGNIMTEYEEKFSSMGNPICKLIADR